MTRIAIIFDSATGRTERLARALSDGAAEVPGAEVTLARIAPLGPAAAHGDDVPTATAALLAGADGIAIGTPVHLGAPSAAVMAFLAATGRLWLEQGLDGRVGTAFAGAGSGGGSETALSTLFSVMAVHGMIIVPGAPRSVDGPGGGSPLGAIALASSPDTAAETELARARAQGARLARVAGALRALR
ncbi:MAG: NAD(P)H-dependent oxidoreductase [Rhodobacteraceae bacterium]|nr:NAD(P)H-dependent oxidoreductase [Paracoccaceae bacterium]